MFGIFLALTLGLMSMGYAYAAVQSHPVSQIAAIAGTYFGADVGLGDYYFPGNVGIGTTSPLSKFDVKNPSGTDLQYVGLFRNLNNAATNNGLLVTIARSLSDAFALDVKSGGISRLYVSGDGNVGIGTTEPASKLVVTGTVNIADKPGTDVNSPSLIIGDIWDTSAAGGVFDIADNVWLTQQRHRMYVLNGIRTDGDIIVETGNLNVGGKTNIFVPVVPWTVIDCGGGSSWTGTCDFTVDTSYSAIMLAVRPDIRSDKVIVGFYTGSGGTGTKIGWIRTPTGFHTNGAQYYSNPAYATVVLPTTVKSAKIEEHGSVWDYGSDWGDNIIIMGYLR